LRTSARTQGGIKLRSGAGFQPATAGILPATILAAAKNWFLLTALGLEAPLGRLEA
jgi:hypothetical protein